MSASEKIRYLKIDRGRYFYQRRIPLSLRECFPGLTTWRRPCGNVTYSKAVQLVVTWAEEHDQVILKLQDLTARQAYTLAARQTQQRLEQEFFADQAGKRFFELPAGDVLTTPRGAVEHEPNWEWAKFQLADLEVRRTATSPSYMEQAQFIAILSRWREKRTHPKNVSVPPYEQFRNILEDPLHSDFKPYVSFDTAFPEPLNDLEYCEQLREIHELAFGATTLPTNADDREEFLFIKNRIERRISEISPDPNIISSTLEKYISFNQVRPQTARKYRRDVARLTELIGDIPVSHVTPAQLKQLREGLKGNIKPASLHAVFTPIKGLLKYAFTEGLIRENPISAVALPRDKRPIEERKWKKFEPHEVFLIDAALHDMFLNKVRGISEERRQAFVMVCRALMFSGMRPIEALRLKPDDIDNRSIRIVESKTESSTRVIPLHPAIIDFCPWVKSGGLETFREIKTDPVGAIRHNFSRLIRAKLAEPIPDTQKTLYSLRSTFVNAMRRSGADIQMQRAILGHKESGAIRHYDDGPEFERMYDAVAKTDPRRP